MNRGRGWRILFLAGFTIVRGYSVVLFVYAGQHYAAGRYGNALRDVAMGIGFYAGSLMLARSRKGALMLNGQGEAARPKHGCPGCGEMVPRRLLSCRICWARLPEPLRDKVNHAYKMRQSAPLTHLRAIAEASQWYRDNPAPASPGR